MIVFNCGYYYYHQEALGRFFPIVATTFIKRRSVHRGLAIAKKGFRRSLVDGWLDTHRLKLASIQSHTGSSAFMEAREILNVL